ncbi:MAG: hypothetical protein ABSD50_16350, partial [Smithella sp.]
MPEFILNPNICFLTLQEKIRTIQKAEALGPPFYRQPAVDSRWLAAKQGPQAPAFWGISHFALSSVFPRFKSCFGFLWNIDVR